MGHARQASDKKSLGAANVAKFDDDAPPPAPPLPPPTTAAVATGVGRYDEQRMAFGPVLIGMRGAGKSTVGRLVAERMAPRFVFVDTDDAVAERCEMSVSAIFATRGEAFFRAHECEITVELLAQPNCVIATGGGAVLHEAVRRALQSPPRFVVWLRADVETLAARITGSERPSLTGYPVVEEVSGVLAVRDPLYRAAATLTVDVDEMPAELVAGHIAEAFFAWATSQPLPSATPAPLRATVASDRFEVVEE